MKKLDLGQKMTLLANLGVIGGILLLAYELRQNNEFMGAQARFNRLNITVDQYASRIADRELAQLVWKARQKEPLSPFEESLVAGWATRALLVREWSYRELPEDELPVQLWRENTRTLDAHRMVFEQRKGDLNPEFVAWYEENIVNE